MSLISELNRAKDKGIPVQLYLHVNGKYTARAGTGFFHKDIKIAINANPLEAVRRALDSYLVSIGEIHE